MVSEATYLTRIAEAVAENVDTLASAEQSCDAGEYGEARASIRIVAASLRKTLAKLAEIEDSLGTIREAARQLIDATA